MTDGVDINLENLATYLGDHIPGFGTALTASKTASGQSNPTYFIANAAGDEIVLRRKPFGDLLPSAHAIDREYRVMKALAPTKVPVPTMLHYCSDASIIGAEFFLMEKVVGRSVMDPRLQYDGWTVEGRGAFFINMADTLAEMHKLSPEDIGLDDYGKPGNYFERQLGRWTKQYRASETETIAPLEELMAWLGNNMMADTDKSSLVHGDYRIDNFILDPVRPQMKAVVDWELSTLGHPLADVGQVLMQWMMPAGNEGRGMMGVDRKALGIPSDGRFVHRYCETAGLTDMPNLTFPIAFSFFRMAAIIQGVKKRGLEGNASDPEAAQRLGQYVPMFANGALQVIAADRS